MTKSFLKRKIRELEAEIVNAKQSLKLAAKRIEELEHYNGKAKADITAYNRVITGMIKGEVNPCDWCEENEECQLEAKGEGCENWWLAFAHPTTEEVAADDSKAVSIEGAESGT